MTERLNSGELKKIFRVSLHKFPVGLTIVGKYVWQQEEEQKRISVLHWWLRNNHVFPSSSRTFRTQSYWSSIARQCCDSERILPTYLPHRMCVLIFILSSTIDWYLEDRIQGRDRPVSILLATWSDGQRAQRYWKDCFECTTSRTILHNAWKKHQDKVYWVNMDLVIRKGLTFYQIRSNASIFEGILWACCIPKVVRLKIGVPINPTNSKSNSWWIRATWYHAKTW